MNKKLLLFLITISYSLTQFSVETSAAGNKKIFVMAHYMPWFQAPPVSNSWGWHWTMNHLNPNVIKSNGEREIASHFYPLTGPYDSQDKDILEYQVLLMKLSGIDGVLVDWYGNENYNDYGIINQSTNALFNEIAKANLSFSIVYEDQTIKNMISGGHITSNQAIAYGQSAMNYLQSNWFASNTYLKIDNRPVLLNFGPQYFTKSSDWENLFSGLTSVPLLFTEDNILLPIGAGAFPWPPMWKSNPSGILTQSALSDYLNQFYSKSQNWSYRIGSAFPGFYDIYQEAGVSSSYGFLDSQNGSTFQFTLQQAIIGKPNIIQLVTWNDYGEGTNIEPTVEYGYTYLEAVQNFVRTSINTTFKFRNEDLRLPLRLYQLRKKYSSDSGVNSTLDKAFNLLVSDNVAGAKVLVDSLETLTTVQNNNVGMPVEFSLGQNYPNPFNPTTTIRFSIPVETFYGTSLQLIVLKVYDVLGREVTTLVNKLLPAGNYSVDFDADNLSSGVYLYRLEANDYVATKKMILIK